MKSEAMNDNPLRSQSRSEALLHFYQWAGVNVALQEEPYDRFVRPAQDIGSTPENVTEPSTPLSHGKDKKIARPAQILPVSAALETARTQTQKTASLDALHTLLLGYEGCMLKLTAKNTCFSDGTPGSPLMLIGEAPGRDEDIQGKPFVGRSGQLLNHILAAIGLERNHVYIANVIPWRPPGNRTPTPMEVELCRPFIERQIELSAPKLLVALGGPAAKFLTGEATGILRLRGKWLNHQTMSGRHIPVMPTLHPAYLLRSPTHKKFAWADFLQVKRKLQEMSLKNI